MSKSSIYYQKIGDSYLGHSIDSWLFSNSNQADVLIIGGVHGDEIEGILIAEEIKEVFLEKKVNLNFDKIIQAGLAIVPKINPDGSQLNQRSNANNVDLNRNLPTSNWSPEATNSRYMPGSSPASEVETKIFLELVKKLNPKIIISLHSFSKSLLLFPLNLHSEKFLDKMQKLSDKTNLEIVQQMDYKVFGSLSRFGTENNIATLTIELPRNEDISVISNKFLNPILELLNEIP